MCTALTAAAIQTVIYAVLLPCRDGPSQLVMLPEDSIWQLDSSCTDIPWALQELAQHTNADSIVPGQNCHGIFCSASRPAVPTGELAYTTLV